MCTPRLTVCPYLFALFYLGGDGRGRVVSWGEYILQSPPVQLQECFTQKNIVLKLMILNGPLINLLAPSPPSWCTWQWVVKWNSRRASKLFGSPSSKHATLKNKHCMEASGKGKIMGIWRRENNNLEFLLLSYINTAAGTCIFSSGSIQQTAGIISLWSLWIFCLPLQV